MTSEQAPLIFAIKGNALDDGPGIRTVVFFKGCPLSCIWCHNPEGKRREVEISFEAGKCIGCDTCLSVCLNNAIDRENPFFIDRNKCSLCFDCVAACSTGALQRVGKMMGETEILETVLRDKPFYDISGGGVTLSGGEPTLFMDFAGSLSRALKTEGVHTLLQTCGLFALEEFDRQLYSHLDLIYFDIKLMDSHAHAHYCGAPNHTILNNFRELARRAQNGCVPILPRLPLIPRITDTDANLRECASFLQECDVKQVQLLPYHPLWREKNRMLGIRNRDEKQELIDTWLDRQSLAVCSTFFEQAGIRVL
jgi:pyruvate formate lyase activating enzyme